MGQKVNPLGFRMEIKDSPFVWRSRWFSSKEQYKDFVQKDRKIRKFLDRKLNFAGLVAGKIERLKNRVKITLQVSRPGVVIGRGGKNLEQLKKELAELLGLDGKGKELELEVEEVKNTQLSARLVAEKIVALLEKGRRYRGVVGRAMYNTMQAGALGIKVVLSGRIAGVEVSRVEKFSDGKVPLNTLRANIDYYEKPALTKSGYVGIKVYINRGERE